MEIISKKTNCLGTMSFTLKIGKMRKAEEFCAYPIQKDEDGEIIRLQSSHRWAELHTKTGRIDLSARRAQYANNIWLMCCIANGTAEYDNATAEQLDEMLSAIRGTASPKAGGNNILRMYCDNSNANLV